MRVNFLLAVSFLTASFVFAASSEFWKEKPPAQWTDEEVAEISSKSPWAREAQIKIDGGAVRLGDYLPGSLGMGRTMGGMSRSGGMTRSTSTTISRGGGGGMRRTGGQDSKAPDTGPAVAPHLTVRWDSSAPLSAVAARVKGISPKLLQEWATDYYVVTVAGLAAIQNQATGGLDPDLNPSDERLQQMKTELQDASLIRTKNKREFAPDQVEVVKTKDGPLLVFLFSRKDDFSLDDKELTFEARFGRMELKAIFLPKEMTFENKLRL